MLRNKGCTDKMILLGIDGMDPRFTRRLLDEGKLPNIRKLMELGACREDLMLLGAVPTVTPPMWATLATGAYPMTHGIVDFQLNYDGELDVNRNGVYSTYCKAEQLWNITAEAGLKTLVWHWPGGSWPPSSDSENLMVVDGTSPGAMGFFSLRADMEMIAVASDITAEPKYVKDVCVRLEDIKGNIDELVSMPQKYFMIRPRGAYYDDYIKQHEMDVSFNDFRPASAADFHGSMLMDISQMDTLADGDLPVGYSPFYTPDGWAWDVPEGAKEFKLLYMMGRVQVPCLLLPDENGKYDRVAVFDRKEQPMPSAILKKGIMTQVPGMGVNLFSGNPTPVHIYRNMRVMDLAEDGSIVKIWISDGVDLDSKTVFHPQWIHDEVYEKFGYPAPTSIVGCHDMDVLWNCSHEQWKQAAKWQADCLTYMMDEHDVKVIFSHYHGPDLEGHQYMKYLKERENSPHTQEELLQKAEATYALTDEYIGRFIPYIEKGYVLNIFSDHGLICREETNPGIGDGYGMNTKLMQKLGYTVITENEKGRPMIDWANTRAISTGCNNIFINLKGRDRYGIVDPADKYELEEQIITDLYNYKDPKTGHRVITMALHNKDAILLGLGGPYDADIICFVHDDYNFDHGDSLSTAIGHADTSTSPIYLIAGPGIKKNYRTDMYIREVDVAPTAAVLLGVRIPKQCEGAPAYSLLEEEL